MLRANSLSIRTGNNFHRTGNFWRGTGIALLFFAWGNGSDAAVVSHQHSSCTTLPFPPINYPDGARKLGLMLKGSPSSPSTLRQRKGELYVWFGAEIPVGSDPSGLAPSFRQSGRVRATSVDFERRRIRSLALPNYSCQPSASLVIPVNRPHACGAESILSGSF